MERKTGVSRGLKRVSERVLRYSSGRPNWSSELRLCVERVTGIEPAWPAWKAGALPLSYPREVLRQPSGRPPPAVRQPPSSPAGQPVPSEVGGPARADTVPSVTDPTWLDATAQAELVRSGEVTPKELVEAAIDRIQRVNPELNAVVRERFDAARTEAAGGLPDGPFRGVPMLLKDMGCHVAGEETHYGTSFLRDAGVRWPGDSHLARLFRAAGFVSLGRTNVPELGTTVTTEPIATGAARNPWDTGRSTGGSGGGSAAAVAAGMVPVAHASDGGGSIRIPASECGLVGLKPTRARVSQGPDVGESWGGATIDGVVTRSVRDAAAVLDAIGRPMPGDPYVAPPFARPLVAEVGAPLGRLRVGLLDTDPGKRYLHDPACAAGVEQTGRLLEELGCFVEPGTPPAMFEPLFSRFFTTMISADTALTISAFERFTLGRSIDDAELEPRNRSHRAVGRMLTAEDYLGARMWLGSWTRKVAAFWAPSDL